VLTIGVHAGWLFAGTGTPVLQSNGTFTGATGVGIGNLDFGVAIMRERTASSGALKSYYALKGSGTAGIYGVDDLVLQGTLTIEANLGIQPGAPQGRAPPLDLTQLSGGGLSVPTGISSSILLDFAGFVLRARGTVTLAIGGFAYVNGGFVIEQGAPKTITLANGHSGAASVLSLGITNATAFFGVGGVTS